ncbi:hypothetical protein CCHL11_00342 [Colletotrichum chlorophyti]|uniref:Uncharacterized protein n=1 Tax=Colletotrichum chlorophyti TaxID=708187 RepID=A0A1Q8RUY3_9PEZI|nr:hypothetical protein CCHL11_00342 [Colletotrichum chlorophyti]
MPQSYRKHGSKSSSSSRESRRSSESCDSYETYESQSTTPTSYYASTQASVKDTKAPVSAKFQPVYEEDISPSTSNCPRSSTDTFDSSLASEDEDEDEDEADLALRREADLEPSVFGHHEMPPVYYRNPLDAVDVRPSTPHDFAQLFPSMNKLSIRHDDLTPDGNMNLRVDALAPGAGTRRPYNIQLFHLRMYDLARRDFSLRRYCRDSGREVCNAKRKYLDEPAADETRPTLQRSVSSAIKTLSKKSTRKPLSRTNSGGSVFGSKTFSEPPSPKHKPDPKSPTNSIKLEFSNYARVDLHRRGSGKSSKRYAFDWWGHTYTWRRVPDPNLPTAVSFHLVRDNNTSPSSSVAHIVPEPRSPTQLLDDEASGAWVPPCHMWISDPSVLEAVTDVADVIVATGLLALVDDCIKTRWGSAATAAKKLRFFPASMTDDGPRTFMQNIFQRRPSDQQSSPIRHRPISTY